MAFPATYNISYYRGDTYDFIINPKNSNGAEFDLDGYSGLFVIASDRGSIDYVIGNGTASVDVDNSKVICKIPSSLGSQLSGTSYVYDVSIENTSSSSTYTLLTGEITVKQDIGNTEG